MAQENTEGERDGCLPLWFIRHKYYVFFVYLLLFDVVYFIVTWFIQRCLVSWICSSVTSCCPGHRGFSWKKLASERGWQSTVPMSCWSRGSKYTHVVVTSLRFQCATRWCMSNDGLESTCSFLGIQHPWRDVSILGRRLNTWMNIIIEACDRPLPLKDSTILNQATYMYKYIYTCCIQK